ncbi:hypothetical protein FCV25MIE_20433 [Fagus crenata]
MKAETEGGLSCFDTGPAETEGDLNPYLIFSRHDNYGVGNLGVGIIDKSSARILGLTIVIFPTYVYRYLKLLEQLRYHVFEHLRFWWDWGGFRLSRDPPSVSHGTYLDQPTFSNVGEYNYRRDPTLKD